MPPKKDEGKKKNNNRDAEDDGLGWLGAAIMGVGAVLAIGAAYMFGKEEGREEERKTQATDPTKPQSSSPYPSIATAPSSNSLASSSSSSSMVLLPPSSSSSTSSSTHDTRFDRITNDTEAQHLCCVCLDQPTNTVFMDCRHQSCCLDCALKLKECPICKKVIKTKPIKIFKS